MLRLLTRPSMREWVWAVALLTAAFALVVAPQQAMEGARTGLSLCGNVIIPSLFPFLILSALVVRLGLAHRMSRLLEPVMEPLFRLNGTCACALVLGFIGGYPIGARTAIDLYHKGQCTRTEAQRLLAFCNNSGPAFILGVVGAGVFADPRVGLLLYLIHALASLCVGLMFRFYRGEEKSAATATRTPPIEVVRFSTAFTDAVASSLQSCLNICAFVIFFSVLLALLNTFGVLSTAAKMISLLFSGFGMTEEWASRLLTGLLELSSGVWSLSGIGMSTGRVSLAAFLLGWAGLSVHCQVLSFLNESDLSIRTYFVGKALHGFVSAGVTTLVLRWIPLSEPVSVYLTDAVEFITIWNGFSVGLISTLIAGSLFLFLLNFRKNRQKGTKKVMEKR